MKYTIALCGNPNSGKTTLFNDLTGSSQYVGNWPGVTVEKKQGIITDHKDYLLVDLPGIYSLSPYTTEEVVARDFLLQGNPDVIINIVDASNLERNLYLTSQLAELGIPIVLALNMMDIVESRKDKLDSQKLSQELGLPVVEIVALRGKGNEALMQEVIAAIDENKKPRVNLAFAPEIEDVIAEIEADLAQLPFRIENPEISPRWYAIKALERDENILREPLQGRIEDLVKNLETEFGEDSQTIISTGRYQDIEGLYEEVYTEHVSDQASITEKIDRIVTNRFLALPIFIGVIFLIYYIAVSTVGTLVTDWANDVFVAEWIQAPTIAAMESFGVSDWLVGLVGDGIIAGVGAVLGFLPQLAILFLLLGLLEESGYMARIAFILDRIFRRFGLSGKSFIPMLIGTGCSVPGIMAARTIENVEDRRMTAITTSFIPCGAKLPIIALIAATLFSDAWWVGPFAYFLGIATALISGLILKKTKAFAGEPAPFIMELPEYRVPTLRNLFRGIWERMWAFIRNAATIILVSSIIIWFLQAYGWENGFVAVDNPEYSFLAAIGSVLAWIFAPLGFGSWQATVATITGLVAKENVVSTFGILFGISGDANELLEAGQVAALSPIADHFTPASGLSFLIFNLICVPCFAAVGAMRRELGTTKWTLFGIAYQTLIAYSISLVYYQGYLLTLGKGFTVFTAMALVTLVVWLYLIFRKPYKPASAKLGHN